MVLSSRQLDKICDLRVFWEYTTRRNNAMFCIYNLYVIHLVCNLYAV